MDAVEVDRLFDSISRSEGREKRDRENGINGESCLSNGAQKRGKVLERSVSKSVCISDSVHGTIEFPPLLIRFIDTPQFQRLRAIKQLGTASFVYPTATHSRFEHSLGTAYLALKVIKRLREKQEKLGISKRDVLCVGLAALCHDLGHGPFSHLFDGGILKNKDWKHEQGSVDMLDYLIKDNAIDVRKYELEVEDIEFVKSLILGKSPPDSKAIKKMSETEKIKWFLNDIVNNKRSGFDVDKWDYIIRDDRYTNGGACKLDLERLICSAEVRRGEDDLGTICFPEKMYLSIFSVFVSRQRLHTSVYQHRVVISLNLMLLDVFKSADQHMPFGCEKDGKDDKTKAVYLSNSVDDLRIFSKLKDSLLDCIEMSTSNELKHARALIERIRNRDLYRCCGKYSSSCNIKKEDVEDFLVNNQKICSERFRVAVSYIHYGSGHKNPMNNVMFFGRDSHKIEDIRTGDFYEYDDLGSTQSAPSEMYEAQRADCYPMKFNEHDCNLPTQFASYYVRVYSVKQEYCYVVNKGFAAWQLAYESRGNHELEI